MLRKRIVTDSPCLEHLSSVSTSLTPTLITLAVSGIQAVLYNDLLDTLFHNRYTHLIILLSSSSLPGVRRVVRPTEDILNFQSNILLRGSLDLFPTDT